MPATLDKLEQLLKRHAHPDESLTHSFARVLFSKASPEFLGEFDTESLMAIAVDTLKRLEHRPDSTPHVRVYNPSYDADGWEADYTVLELSLDDRPFIVDSVRAELKRQNVTLYHFLHPIIGTERDAQGKLLSVAKEGTPEAFELYFIEHIAAPERQAQLEAAVLNVLKDVVLSTDDYRPMQERTCEVYDYLQGLRARGQAPDQSKELDEYADFMSWLTQDNFVFLGYREYDILEHAGSLSLKVDEGSALGILRKLNESAYREPIPLENLPGNLRERLLGGNTLIVTKTNAESTVHRPARMDYIGIKKLNAEGEARGEYRFVGLFTSKALSTPVEEIPILRRRLRQVLELDNATPGSHDYKSIVSIFNSLPREELFWSDAPRLHKDLRTIMGIEEERGVRLTLRPDPLARGLAVMVIMPRERFNGDVRRLIQDYLIEKLAATHVDYQLAISEDEAQVRFHFFFTTEVSLFDLNATTLERYVAEFTRTWEDHLSERICATHGEMGGKRLCERYLHAFDERYKADISPKGALRDIESLEALGENAYYVDIVNPLETRPGDEKATHLKIYHLARTLVLSEVLPLLENLGFRVLEQISYYAQLGKEGGKGIDIFRVQTLEGEMLDVRQCSDRLKAALLGLLNGEAENDRLNHLVLYAGLSVRQVALLRVYGMYYSQLNAVTSRSFITDTLLNHPEIAGLIYRAFALRFQPELSEREAQSEELRTGFLDSLNAVSSLPEDRTLRGMFNLIESTLRTNFFLDKPYISFKIDSQAVSDMPQPRPRFEIVVASRTVEGIHLRGGLVARGGIRWSDRPDDFRTEVLGLMKTQMTKNAVIVPVGSKGGFIIKNAPASRDALRAYVEEQYKTFIRGLLDLTDNIVNGVTVHPQDLVMYDGADPYLVVAADKGTATFSDIANSISEAYGFWLGDAFASGGSQGYDHKKEGITARGAWVCVERHFRELGINVHEDAFTVAGIGDMSGDVFGNGMLYTPKMKLLAAFNHMHIFLDPDPNPEASFAERKRLFELPRSTWADYDASLVSEGGGIHSRFAKSIPLTPQVQAMLGVTAEALSGQDLIKAILRMPVDLLWNGGIGTYVKSSSERDAEVGDSSNDPVRIDAADLRARVVGEGGNLGFTQLSRIEFACAGGKINTDAIDNSGGVDMSDHEVNIKILLQPLVASGDLSTVQRNRLLKEMTDDVSLLVLGDNYTQSLCLSLSEKRSRDDIMLFESLMNYLAEYGSLKPEVEFLPSHRTIEERRRNNDGLTRPELAILLAYTKMGVFRRLLETPYPDEAYFEHYLFSYFPKAVQERYPEAIRQHRLRREIVATQFTNTLVDLLGITFIHRSIRDTGASPAEVILAALVAIELLDVAPLVRRICALDYSIPAEAQYAALHELVRAVEGVVNWILLSDISVDPVASFVSSYREPLLGLRRDLETLLPETERNNYRQSLERYTSIGFPADLAADIASLDYLPSGMGVVDVSRLAGVSLQEAATHFYAFGGRLSLGWLRDTLAVLPSASKWEKIALGGLIMDLRQAQRQLTIDYFVARPDESVMSLAYLETHPRLLKRYDTALSDMQANDGINAASGGVLVRILEQMLEGA